MVTLVLGGARSGKSSWAEQYALSVCSDPERRCYLAAGVACDAEMSARIAKHRERRAGKFFTVEEPLHLAEALHDMPAGTEVVLIDCLTTWLGNLTYEAEKEALSRGTEPPREESLDCFPEIAAFAEALRGTSLNVVMVSNELGWGIVPADAETRLFRDRQGRLNQLMAEIADQAVVLIAGLPLYLKRPD